ncbi:MAG: glutathione synthase [Candidatus Dasytiphilus stammeri]
MIKLGIVMDPIHTINIKKDTTFAILLQAQQRYYDIFYMEMHDLYILEGIAYARTRKLQVKDDINGWFSFGVEQHITLDYLDVIIMRKNPPFDTELIYATYILELAENKGTLIINKPQSLRDCNEKIFINWFPDFIIDTLVTRNAHQIIDFWKKHGDIILKPLDSMGGHLIFKITKNDPNLSVIIEILTNYGNRYCMVQKFIPDISQGDKRIFIIDGQPIPYCLARIPLPGEIRGNLMAGGHGKVQSLSSKDWEIAHYVSPILQKKGLLFVGLDIIGDKLTEINITSPTCVREIEAECTISITGMFLDIIEKRLKRK